MKRVLKFLQSLNHLSYKWKLMGTYALIMAVTAGILSLVYYSISIDQVTDNAKNMAYEILRKNNQILDERLQKIKENSAQAVVDSSLFTYLSEEEVLAKENYLGLDRKITQVLNKYFPSGDVMSVQLITDDHIYGVNTSLLTAQRFKDSSIYQDVLDRSGALIWTPVYDIVNMYHLDEYREIPLPNQWVFSAARTLGNGYVNSEGIFENQPLDTENKPVLLINFSQDLIYGIFEDSMPVQGAETYLLSPAGEMIYHGGQESRAAEDLMEIYQNFQGKKSGSDVVRLNGETIAISYITSDVTGWISLVLMPSHELMRTARTQMQVASGIAILCVLFIGGLLSLFFSSMVSRPIHQTVEAMQKLGAGDFDTTLTAETQDEFGYLVEGFNTMNQRISRLIEDNYIAKLWENEMELMALNLQLNPHFLHNTLSVINYEALETGQDRVSEMIMHLCDMRSYTFHSTQETSMFREDLRWMENYVDIMMYRFENKFVVYFDIPEELLEIQVPKLFLQPFIENSILHGFEFIDSGGVILVSGYQEGEKCIIIVEDNGIGMDASEEPLPARKSSGSVGIANVQQRIHLLYGDDYGVKISSEVGRGTRVIITLPGNTKP